MSDGDRNAARLDVKVGSAATQGVIVCPNGSLMSCYSRYSARRCAQALMNNGLLTENERAFVLQEIQNSALPERSKVDACVFYPAECVRGLSIKPQGIPVLRADVFAVEHLFELGEPNPETRH